MIKKVLNNITRKTKNGYVILSGDILKTVPKIVKQAEIHLKDKKSVVIDATNGKAENRKNM